MPSTPYANYEVVALSGAQSFPTGKDSGYVSAATIHEIYCLAAGSIIITPVIGPSFTWAATINTSMSVLVKATTVSSGTFIGFRGKFTPNQFFGTGRLT